ncbi:hypothetical protein ERUR111494_02410 [Erysipelothrix urinaevulpis]|uniref:hypothetical protein n=1 Tax=Erysipelothrix urinaevulpis TaxID=2683717 RepID=UPI00135A979D|nr:hypothetical protein [Erysipelothrix urinaevulpis]
MNEFEQFCEENNLRVILTDNLMTMPKGMCYPYNGQYYVVLNNKHSFKQLQKTTIHEIIHVLENHFHYPTNMAEKLEKEVEELIDNLYQKFIIEFSYV